MDSKKIIGIGIFAALVIIIIIIGVASGKKDNNSDVNKNGENTTEQVDLSKYTTVYVATGGGKEDFLADEDVVRILREKYNINAVFDSWSNGKTVLWPLIREQVSLGDSTIINNIKNGQTYTITSDGVSKYDALFTSDQRYYDYYRLSPDKEKGEADRYTVLDGGLTLNTPIVIYSWKELVEPLINEKIVEEVDGVYYITDMNKLIEYDLAGKKWSDIGVKGINKTIHITSTDPVTSSPGATYYGLLLSILSDDTINDTTFNKNITKLDQIYKASGYMNNTPADLFQRYYKLGVGGYQMIVDYEKSLIEFINEDPTGYEQVKDKMVVLYPSPTLWNSHCFAVFTENGALLYKALQDSEIQQIAWEKYGFRTGVSGGSYDTSKISGIPQELRNLASGLKMTYYEKMVSYLKENNTEE